MANKKDVWDFEEVIPSMKGGTVNFDPLTVFGRDFMTSVHKADLNAFDYAFSVKPHLSNAKRKKDEPQQYTYHWSGHFNLLADKTRIHLHNPSIDPGLYRQERKMLLIKEHVDFYVAETKRRLKKANDKELNEKLWLNDEAAKYTGYIFYTIEQDGSGKFAIADCHRSIYFWVDHWAVKMPEDDLTRTKTLKLMEDLSKGLGRAIKAVQELRKFFERELESGN